MLSLTGISAKTNYNVKIKPYIAFNGARNVLTRLLITEVVSLIPTSSQIDLYYIDEIYYYDIVQFRFDIRAFTNFCTLLGT